MAVYRKTYTRYEGGLTPEWSRFLVLARYTLEELRASRFFSLFFPACFLWPVMAALVIYVRYNLETLTFLNLKTDKLIVIGPQFFMNTMGFQSMLAFFLATFVGPGLVAPDLANNGLSLFLARPLSKTGYVLGRLVVLAGLLSMMTWIPGLLLYALQSYMEGGSWWWDNLRIANGILIGSCLWILLISLLALALSAWVKWKPIAGSLMFGVFFVAGGFAAVINEVLRTRWGNLLNVGHLMGSVWVSLFEVPMKRGQGGWFFRVAQGEEIPIWCCWLVLTALCALCLYMLSRKIRGVEVVR